MLDKTVLDKPKLVEVLSGYFLPMPNKSRFASSPA